MGNCDSCYPDRKDYPFRHKGESPNAVLQHSNYFVKKYLEKINNPDSDDHSFIFDKLITLKDKANAQ